VFPHKRLVGGRVLLDCGVVARTPAAALVCPPGGRRQPEVEAQGHDDRFRRSLAARLSHRLDTGLFILVSSLLRTQIGRPLWRSLHYLVFPCAALLFLHSILTDPNLKDGHPDLLDGGKVFVEIASLISLTATTIRIRLRGKGFRCK
jgi:hypothetical protein